MIGDPVIAAPIRRDARHAFTLVELSIVLVILGLLVGGVLAGQSLIRAAELRAVTTEHGRWLAATHSFRDKYFALPGDMTNAQSFWGVAHATPATCVTTVGSGTTTCNGNGDGRVVGSTGSREYFRFWQQLANAGLIEGSYTGVEASAGNSLHTSTVNAPKSKLGTGLWFAYNYATQSGNASLFNGVYENILELGAPSPTEHPYNPLVKPEEVWNIDTKMDDGRPGTGNLVVRGVVACSDTTYVNPTTANYRLSSSTIACGFVFREVY